MLRLHKDPSISFNFEPVIAVMRLMGHIYAAKEWSPVLKDHAESCLSQSQPDDPVLVQSRLLYSIALFWYNFKDESKQQMDVAIRVAVDIKMFHADFAKSHSFGDPVMAECWRRTWWMLFVIDAYYAGTLGTMNFTVVDVEATVELPCDEGEYESGDIPEPQTLEDFDSREFAPEQTSFSSFAYLISAVRCAAQAISTTPKIASAGDSAHLIQSADSIIDGWVLLLPKDRQQVMSKAGKIDEIMFQAQLLIGV
ncbi:C6 zinc finger protein [Colletotrichum karsti]|uniref:C6 zinc finger protein n=1 Tax=Colletotrichum karsti TaxID=1095194 RepID=A0A9P6HVA5_9PEZI|nr:C6 zinc finger protein [Colletotrichum karsti]KAF9871443.1 C6 zinc finger protein [Colletotrichum karsti]